MNSATGKRAATEAKKPRLPKPPKPAHAAKGGDGAHAGSEGATHGPAGKSMESVSGRVRLYLLSPHGDVDGLLLEDGLQVATPPHLASALVDVVGRGDAVEVRGHRESAGRLVGKRILNRDSGLSVEDHGPEGPHRHAPDHGKVGKPEKPEKPAKPAKPDKGSKHARPRPHERDAGVRLDASGTIAVLLQGKHGEINGAVLDEDTVLRFPRHTGVFYADALVVGNRVDVCGMGLETRQGRVVHVQELRAR